MIDECTELTMKTEETQREEEILPKEAQKLMIKMDKPMKRRVEIERRGAER